MLTPQENESTKNGWKTHILHLEDYDLDRELVRHLLEQAGLNCAITAVETRLDFERELERGDWDLILADYSLPAFNGLEALAIAEKTCPNTPFIFVSGVLGEDIAVESLKGGATDYVLKQRMARLSSSVNRALKERDERLRRKKGRNWIWSRARSGFVFWATMTLLRVCPIGLFCKIGWRRPLPARDGTR